MEATPASLVSRMIRAARLDNELYEEVEREEGATRQALYVVLIAAVAGGIGGAVGAAIKGAAGGAAVNFIGGVVLAIVGWALWSGITYFVGTRLFQGTATYGELLRTIGFANAPGVLNVLNFIPLLGGLIAFIAAIWALVAGVVAVRQALDITTGKAIITTVVGWIPFVVAIGVVAALVAAA